MLEAMKCGLPILATNNQISKEILSSTGFFAKIHLMILKTI